ncbi:MAG: cupin domain-containing protein [Myxococcota bacterium]|nr:cupin domain-containing protein [Myxococcota bacterium]
MSGPPPFPGAIGASHLRVYQSEAPDGLCGGTPHVHFVCTEAYWVVRGRGRVQTLSAEGFRETPLEPGSFVWFTPGTIHRLINESGDLEILVLMQNAGLPEAGDMVITFPEAELHDVEAYRGRHVLSGTEATTAGSGEAARVRRDLGVEGFLRLRADVESVGLPALTDFYRQAAALVRPEISRWRALWESGPRAAAHRTGEQLDALEGGDVAHLLDASLHHHDPPPDERRMGCCGTLGVYVAPTD